MFPHYTEVSVVSLLLIQPSESDRAERAALATMNRIGKELVQERKEALLGERKPQIETDEQKTESDLLAALVRANLGSETQRMDDTDVLARELMQCKCRSQTLTTLIPRDPNILRRWA